MPSSRIPNGRDLKQRYPAACPQCNHTFDAVPSWAMLGGFNTGSMPCAQCDTLLHLEIALDNDRMTAVVWRDYIEEELFSNVIEHQAV